MSFHPDQDLQRLYNGFQGAPPNESRMIFLGMDANFPEFHGEGDERRTALLSFLQNDQHWRRMAFRTQHVPLYLNRNDHPGRAHHPSLLSCFNGTQAGAPYHRRVACTIDRILEQIQQNEVQIQAADLVNSISFVDLCRFPTLGNNGNHAPLLFQAGVPANWEAPANFVEHQRNHRNGSLPKWLLQHDRLVVMPESVFKVLCKSGWHGLDMAVFQSVAQGWPENQSFSWPNIANPDPNQPENPFQNCQWLVTRAFPYFSAGWQQAFPNGDVSEAAVIEAVAEEISDWLNPNA